MSDFRSIVFPVEQEYSSDGENQPIEFYLNILPKSKTIYLKLGYFSSQAIQLLAYGFAQFIFNGGNMKIITNHFLYNDDKALLTRDDLTTREEEYSQMVLNNLDKLKDELTSTSKHFFNCLVALVKMDRLEIIPVMLKPGRMVHFKQGLFEDSRGNKVFMDGSCNFTANGLIGNAETISIFKSWGEKLEIDKIQKKETELNSILSKKSDKYEYLAPDRIVDAVKSIGEEKNVLDLLKDELDLLEGNHVDLVVSNILKKHERTLKLAVEKFQCEPRFPYWQGPRDYQKEAYDNWCKNNKQGIFAMATGTGKTITALNCLLNEYQELKFFQSVILVPSIALLKQWSQEVELFNFGYVLCISSRNSWKSSLETLRLNLLFEKNTNFILIITYQTFATKKFQEKIIFLPDTAILIADEAHNMASNQMKEIIDFIPFKKRIALSATPNRKFDEEGNGVLEKFFNSIEPYTYSFSMERAINEEVLCRYFYFPKIVYLTEEEMEVYEKISNELLKYFDFSKGRYYESEVVSQKLIERKRVIHKAQLKKSAFRCQLKQHKENYGSINYSLLYVPEGDEDIYSNHSENLVGRNLLSQYVGIIEESEPSIKVQTFTSNTSNKDVVMDLFTQGSIDVLASMKCLDEGVDIPRAQTAFFCSSSGNPRQFIQRRGRVLRKHVDKKYAYIYDLIVFPVPSQEPKLKRIETKMVRDELTRVLYFSSLSENYYESMEVFGGILDDYDLDIFALQYELMGD